MVRRENVTFWTSRRERYERVILSEFDYESLLISVGDQAFEGWRLCRWKSRVFTPEGRGVEADAILISESSDEWAVVEIELASHSISGHVQDQLERLSAATYGSVVTSSLAVAAGVNIDQARRFTRRRPDFLCIADDHTERLSECCMATGFQFAVMQPYRSSGQSALRGLRIPGHYRKTVNVGSRFVMLRSSETFFGHAPFVVPDTFPGGPAIRLEVDSEIHEVKLTTLRGSRMLFLNAANWSSGLDRLSLTMLSAENDVYRVDIGVGE